MMGNLDLENLKDGFVSLVHCAKPDVLPEFVAWIEVKTAELKYTSLLHPMSLLQYSPYFDHPHMQETQYCKDIKSLKKMISKDDNSSLSSTVNSVNSTTSQSQNLRHSNTSSALAKLLANNKTSPFLGSKLTLKVPSVPTTTSTFLNSPISQQGSPPHGTDSYSALRSLLQSSARVDLTEQFQERGANNDSENKCNVVTADERINGRTLDCSVCGKSFLHRSSFRRHMKIHQGVFSHSCDKCDKKFMRKEHFLRHKCCGKNMEAYDTDDMNVVSDARGLTKQDLMSNDGRYAPLSPVDMSSKWSDISSVSSGPASPPLPLTESRRKKSAPRKFVCGEVSPQHEDYLSDIDESIYAGAVKTENGVLDFSMKKEKLDDHDTNTINKPLLNEATLDLSVKNAECIQESQAAKLNSPSSGFRIGDLISNAVTKYHSLIEPTCPNLKQAETPAVKKLDQFSQEFKVNNIVQTEDSTTPAVNETNAMDSNFLAMDTGTYQITTEDVDSDHTHKEEGTPNKVIKVVKQGNYLKLKKEAQLIDGELRFICPHCNKVFHRSSNFSRHMRIHRGVFSYICSACNRGFYRKEHFDKHKCYRKAMATTWERKTRVEMDKEEKTGGEYVGTDEEGTELTDPGMDLTDHTSTYEGEFPHKVSTYNEEPSHQMSPRNNESTDHMSPHNDRSIYQKSLCYDSPDHQIPALYIPVRSGEHGSPNQLNPDQQSEGEDCGDMPALSKGISMSNCISGNNELHKPRSQQMLTA